MTNKELQSWFKRAVARAGGRGEFLNFLFNDKNLKMDMHVHSDVSDGRKTTTEIGNEAEEAGVKMLAVVDHDTIKAQQNLANASMDLGDYSGGFLNAVEITARMGASRVEILVYGYDLEKATELVETFQFPFMNRKFKIQRNAGNLMQRLEVVNRLGLAEKQLSLNDFIGVEMPNSEEPVLFSQLGLDVFKDLNFLEQDFLQTVEIDGKTYNVNFDNFNSKLFSYIIKTEQGKAFLAGFKNAKGEPVSTFADFNRFVLQVDGTVFALSDSNMWPSVEECVEFARKSGGVALLAHPFGYAANQGTPERLVSEAIVRGVDGIEIWHGFNTAEEVYALYNLCKEEGLFISVGSDSHGYPKSRTGRNYQIGTAPGFEGSEDKNFIYETELTTKTLHFIGSGEYAKQSSEESNNSQPN